MSVIIRNSGGRWNGVDYTGNTTQTLAAGVETAMVNAGFARWAPGSAPAVIAPAALSVNDQGVATPVNPANNQPVGGSGGEVGGIYVPKVATYGGVMDAIALAQADLALGKTATVRFQPELYDIGAAGQGFPVLSGLTYEGGGYRLLAGNLNLNGGTIIQGNGAFDIFTGNDTARASRLPMAQVDTYYAERITAAHIRNLAIKSGRNGIKVGALYRAGAFNSSLRDLYIQDCTGWGYELDNWGYSEIGSIDIAPKAGSVGAGFFSGSGGQLWDNGNMHITDLFSEGGDYKTRGFVFMARGEGDGSSINDINLFRLQRNASGIVNGLRVSAGMTNGSPNINVPDASAFPLDMPVTVTTTANGFNQWETYFVVQSAGTTVQLSYLMGGPAINASGNAAVQLCCFGRPALEIVGYGSNNSIKPSRFAGLDTEGAGGSMVLVQRAQATVALGTCFSGRGVSTASSLVMRDNFGSVSSTGGVSIDFDQGSAFSVNTVGLNIDVSSGVKVGHLPIGLMRRSDGKIGLNLWPSPGGQPGDISLRGVGVSGAGHIYPEHSLSQRVWSSTATTLNMFGIHLGCGAFVGTANAVWNMPTLTGASGGASNSWVGAVMEICNASTTPGVTLTLNTAANQPCNRQAGKTSVVLQPGQSFAVRAQTNNGTDWFWQVIGNNGVTI
jgi:hypothetical protein